MFLLNRRRPDYQIIEDLELSTEPVDWEAYELQTTENILQQEAQERADAWGWEC